MRVLRVVHILVRLKPLWVGLEEKQYPGRLEVNIPFYSEEVIVARERVIRNE